MEEFRLRPAKDGDLPVLVEIDDEASLLYSEAGISFDLEADHPFVKSESLRWGRAITLGRVCIAESREGRAVGFAVLGTVDGEPYLDQIAVRPEAMRRGIGTALMRWTFEQTAAQRLWLTTYAQVPWNGPYYERFGFRTVPESEWGADVRATIASQRAVLPSPENRIAMVRNPAFTTKQQIAPPS